MDAFCSLKVSTLSLVPCRMRWRALQRRSVPALQQLTCCVQDLRELRLTRISDYFSDEHIDLIAQQLPKLEDLYIGGYGVSDAVLTHLTNLRNLKVVTFSGVTSFTESGIIDFVNQLGEVRRGLPSMI